MTRRLLIRVATILAATHLLLSFLAEAHSVPAAELSNKQQCETRRRALESKKAPSEAERALVLLFCELRPLVDSFTALIERARGPKQVQKSDNQWDGFSDTMAEFYSESFYLLDRSEFCTYPVIKRLKALCRSIGAECGADKLNAKTRPKAHSLIQLAFDLLAIEFHERCLLAVLPKLPPVPYLVRDVVKIYITGADKTLKVPDLNEGGVGNPSDPNEQRLALSGLLDANEFDVEHAIKSQGPLAQVMSLLISFTSTDKVQEFKDACKEFVMEIEQRWQSFEMLSTMIASKQNGIRQLNNYVMRSLIPTRYADICSQLSERS